ncbi:TonB-dependent receptor [Isoalcanivorax beigongshangi]|uniref:TonB-dependent receptor n=1 Tax=Isoalcanivorax beigongshangi TaxID=3238810 RepID=A0ABV4AL33_9GAMM
MTSSRSLVVRRRRWLLCAALSLAPLAVAAPVLADSGYQVAAQPLGSALTQLARDAGVQLSFDSALVAPFHALEMRAGSVGAMLDQLLLGTGLRWGRTSGGVYVIEALAPLDERADLSLGPVTVIGEAGPQDEPYRSSGSAVALTQRDIELFRGTSVGDIFKGTTGVLVGENRNSGGLDVNIRGMQGQSRVPILIDGSRQETTVYRGYAGVSSRTYVDPDLIGSIYIEKGPVMGVEGTGATGGVVNMTTLRAEDIVKPGATEGVRLRASALGNNSGKRAPVGSTSGYNVNNLDGLSNDVYRINCVTPSLCEGPHDINRVMGPSYTMNRPQMLDLRGWAGSLAVAKRFESVDLVAAYAQRRQGNYYAGRHGPTPELDLSDQLDRKFWTEVRPTLTGASRFRGGERIANSHMESTSTLLKAHFFLPDDHDLELGFIRYVSDYGELMPSQLLWLGEVRETGGSHVDARTYTARHRWNPAAWMDRINLRANLWHTDTDSSNQNYSEELTGSTGVTGKESEDYQRWGADLSNGMRFVGGGEWHWHYGVSWQEEKLRTEDGAGGAGGFVDTSGRQGSRDEVSAFTSLKWAPVDSVEVEAGVRYTRFTARDRKPYHVTAGNSACVDSNGDGQCDPLSYRNTHSGTAPVVSASWEFLPGQQLYVRYAEALRMPSLFESTSGFSTAPALDVELKPEHAKNREIGWNLARDDLFLPGDRLRVKLATFENRTDDYLTRTMPNLWEEDAHARFFTTRNIGDVEFFGSELMVEYDAGRWFTEFGGTRYHHVELCYYGSYRRQTCTDYGIEGSYVNNMIPPNWHASALLGVRLLQNKLELGVRTILMGKRNSTPEFDNETAGGFASPVQWRNYQLYDLFLSYRPNDTVTVDVNVDNVTDRYYLDALSLGLVPAPGRSARLSVALQF